MKGPGLGLVLIQRSLQLGVWGSGCDDMPAFVVAGRVVSSADGGIRCEDAKAVQVLAGLVLLAAPAPAVFTFLPSRATCFPAARVWFACSKPFPPLFTFVRLATLPFPAPFLLGCGKLFASIPKIWTGSWFHVAGEVGPTCCLPWLRLS